MTSQLVVLEPKKEIHFPGPYDKPYTAKLVIENVSKTEVVAFRLMTIEARHYICDPSKGVLGAGQSVTVNIKLLPIKNKATFKVAMQKFMVQVVPAKATSTVDDVPELFAKALTGDIGYFKMIAVFDSLGKPKQRRSFKTWNEELAKSTSSGSLSSGSSSSDERLGSRVNSSEFFDTSKSEPKTGSKSADKESLKKEPSISSIDSKWTEMSSNKSNETVLSSTSSEKMIKSSYYSAKEGAKKKSISSESIPSEKGVANWPYRYISSFKYFTIVAGIVIVGAVVYRQLCSKN